MIIRASTKHATDKKPTAKDDVLLGGVWGNFTGWVNIPKQPEWDIGLPIGYSGQGTDDFGHPKQYLDGCKPYPTGSIITLVQE